MQKHIQSLLMGIGQIMLQGSQVVGLLFLIGLFLNSPLIAAFGLFGLVCGYWAAFKFPLDRQAAGLYGFNAILVGLAMGYFFGFSWLSLIGAGVGGVISTIIMHLMLHFKLRPFTFPFIVTTWGLVSLLKMIGLVTVSHKIFLFPEHIPQWLSALFLGFGQVQFQEHFITGILFFIALLWCSRLKASYALLGSVLGVFVPILLHFTAANIYLGLFAFNPVLCGIALADKQVSGFIFAVAGILLSILFMWLFLSMNLMPLTFPFVLSTWIMLWVKEKGEGRLLS